MKVKDVLNTQKANLSSFQPRNLLHQHPQKVEYGTNHNIRAQNQHR